MLDARSGLKKVIERWRDEGIELLPALPEAEVVQAFAKTRRKVSRDVIELYCTVNGMVDGEMDRHSFYLWSVSRIAEHYIESGEPYLPFGDFLIDSYFYCLRHENETTSSV